MNKLRFQKNQLLFLQKNLEPLKQLVNDKNMKAKYFDLINEHSFVPRNPFVRF